MEILEGLNPEQLRAVEHAQGPMLVVAGAGTGKTQVITRRIAYLRQHGLAKPGEILALTFTEKASREMEERLYDLVGWESFQVPVMTFHAFGTELLGRFASHIGRSIRGGLLNDVQKSLLLRQHIERIKLSYYGPQADLLEFLEGVVAYIGSLQNAGVTVEQYEEYVAKLRSEPANMHPRDIDEQADLVALYRLYETIKRETGTFDYHDQLWIPLQILQSRPNLAERLAREYRYVLVDEYQDTNGVQDALLRTFVGKDGNVFAVGDDDQAIYGFRGAEIGNILAFTEHFKVVEPVVLVRNYRSGQAVLDAAYRLIRHNDPERLEAKLGISKRLIATHGGSQVGYRSYRTAADEQAGVLAAIEERLAQGEKAASIAVLAATHAPLKALAKVMREHQLPFALATPANIFEQPELIGLWYLLKWVGLQADESAIGHVMMGPFIGWTAEQYRQLLEASRGQLLTVEEALRHDGGEAARQLAAQLDTWRGWAEEVPVSQLAFRLVFETGCAEAWRKQAEKSARMVRVFEDLQRLLEQMGDFETVANTTTLREYLRLFPRPPALEVTEPLGDPEGVQLLTVHASKGLEFETVFLIGCSQRAWSGANHARVRPVPAELVAESVLSPDHEFRRLMYVAVTRARRRLLVSAAVETNGGAKQLVSPFVGELFGADVMDQAPVRQLAGGLDNVMKKLQQFYPMHDQLQSKRLPFETSEGWLDLTVTALGFYDYCPFEFYLEHVLQIKQPFGPQLAFGTALHRVFEAYYRGGLAGDEWSSKALHELLDELWSDRGYEYKFQADRDHQLAHETLANFLRREQQAQRQVLGTEVGIRFEISEAKLRLRGKIDALFQTAAGTELRDFKTGRGQTDPEKLAKRAKENFQLRTYALAYEQLKGVVPAAVVLDYVVTGVEGAAQLSSTILRNHRAKLVAMAERIRAREFAANPSPMHECSAIRYYGTGERDALAGEAMAVAREASL